jgi:protein-L-isoaspartate(D-aspartate) O-methyltransferase
VVNSRAADRERLVAAFAAVSRERYVGAGPWQVLVGEDHYVTTPSADLRFLYQDQLVALAQERGINNGSPSSHALWIDALAPRPGEEVIHIGAGTGYYTAVLAELVGRSSTVLAYEIAADLAERAATNLSHLPNVRVAAESALTAKLPRCDVLYVNAAVTDLPDSWLDALRPGGRLMAPLAPIDGFGGMLLVKCRETVGSLDARFVSGAKFIGCVGATSGDTSEKLAAALGNGGQHLVQSLRRNDSPDSTCWYAAERWWLSTAAPS